MAFTGTATVTKVSNSLVRITGLSLAAAAAGTIGLFGESGDVDLPDAFNPKDYGDVDLAESLEVSAHMVTAEAVAPALQVVKTTGPFLITMTNGGGAASGGLEIYVRFHN